MNDLFWGEGFTDWVTTKNARQLFSGHRQPYLPSTLGYYDLSKDDTLLKQAELANLYGIDGYGMYHCMFDETTEALEVPMKIIRNNPSIQIHYFICWVNGDWTKGWVGDHQSILYKQKYNKEVLERVAYNACWHFEDTRYARIQDTPIFYIHNPRYLNLDYFKETFLKISSKNGFNNIAFAAPQIHVLQEQQHEFDYLLGYPPGDTPLSPFKIDSEKFRVIKKGVFSFSKYASEYPAQIKLHFRNKKFIPTVLSGWDNTPRYKENGFVFHDFNHETFSELFDSILNESLENNREFLMIKAWNEWAEGNTLEPSVRHGNKLLEGIKRSRQKHGI